MNMAWLPGWLTISAIALILWGITGVTQKLSTNHISSQLSFIWFAYAMIAISTVLAVAVPIHYHAQAVVFWLAVAGGALNGLGALTSFTALESGGKASVVISLVSLYPLLTVGIAVTLMHEKLTATQGVGIVLAIVAGVLLSLEPHSTDSKENVDELRSRT
jgi:drug/metabolite transporter (DMT)-like permease